MYRTLRYVLRRERLKLLLLACALLAAGCTHDSDDSQDHPHTHRGGGHRGGQEGGLHQPDTDACELLMFSALNLAA